MKRLRVLTLFLLGAGEGDGIHPSGFSSIKEKRENIFSSNLVTFLINQWSQFVPSNLRIDLSMLPWQWLKVREFENDISKKIFFSILTSEMELATIS